MSEENKTETKPTENQTESKSAEPPKEQTPNISLADFEALRAQNEELNSKLNQIEEERAKEQGKWKDLFEAEREKHNRTKDSLSAIELKVVNNTKRDAFNKEVGGLARESYYKQVELDKIQINDDGTINNDSLKTYVEEFRKENPELLAKRGTNMPNRAHQGSGNVDLSKNNATLTREEKQKRLSEQGFFTKGRGV